MSDIIKFYIIFLIVSFEFRKITSKDSFDNSTTSTGASTPFNVPFRYNRYVFFLFSENATVEYFTKTLKKLFELDNYCGGDNLVSVAHCGNQTLPENKCNFCSFEASFSIDQNNDTSTFERFSSNCRVKGVVPGMVDKKDENYITEQLLNELQDIFNFNYVSNYSAPCNVISQIILITDYASEHLGSNKTTAILNHLKSENNITFIALTTDLSNKTANAYFPDEVWKVFTDYRNWTSSNGINPICGLETIPYTTPKPMYRDIAELFVFLLFSDDYIKRTQLMGIDDLLNQLATRRISYPCRQFRTIVISVFFPTNTYFDGNRNLDGGNCVADTGSASAFDDAITCSAKTFRRIIGVNASKVFQTHDANNDPDTCSYPFKKFFFFFEIFFSHENFTFIERNKLLLITDLPMPSSCRALVPDSMLDIIRNYSFLESGAPLTIIAIDKKGDTNSVAKSYEPLFPKRQLDNLYPVNEINDILLNINTSINFCLGYRSRNIIPKKQQPSGAMVWYFYVIGVAIISALLTCFAIILLRRKRKRDEVLRELAGRTNMPSNVAGMNQYDLTSQAQTSRIKDIWEVPLQSLDIDYKTRIGKGAFSVVHLGVLRGKAPVLYIFPSIATHKFADCQVALKTVPQHSDDSDKAKFRSEIELMKEIGYHAHLISMLGCNCSIERPILLMELAKQDLLHWLVEQKTSMVESDAHLDKTLLSICWQIADGMSYLSSKLLIHRDLAARNVLLNNEMKAMVSDFGLCQKLENDEQILVIPDGKLPLKWMALESLQHKQFSLKTDVWSFGILLFEIFTLSQEPYEEVPNEVLATFLQKGKRLHKPELASVQIYDFMLSCWYAESSQRPNFSQIQRHFMAMLESSTATYGYLTAAEQEI